MMHQEKSTTFRRIVIIYGAIYAGLLMLVKIPAVNETATELVQHPQAWLFVWVSQAIKTIATNIPSEPFYIVAFSRYGIFGGWLIISAAVIPFSLVNFCLAKKLNTRILARPAFKSYQATAYELQENGRLHLPGDNWITQRVNRLSEERQLTNNIQILVAITMLSPVLIPGDLLCYLFGLTPLTLREFARIAVPARLVSNLLYGLLLTGVASLI